MATNLIYTDLLPDGFYGWNLRHKIYRKIGYYCHIVQTQRECHLMFDVDLSPDQISDVNAFMADSITACDSVEFATINNRYILKDVWEWLSQLEADCGFNVMLTYRKSGSHPNEDEIVLQPCDPTYQMEKILTNPEKNALEAAIANLGRWE
jgi:hypothetical protein